MNPHFMFNTINSIQFYILENNKSDAIAYLSDFALLIRKSLDFSMTERILIEEEIKFLNLYLSLENKRFDTDFKIEYKVTNQLINTKYIPSLMIQPLIENIIIHADYEDRIEKKIIINITYDHDYFTIKVIDFGKPSQDSKPLTNHKSYGLSILRNRLKLYNGKHYNFDDLKLTPTSANFGKTVTIKLKEWKPLL